VWNLNFLLLLFFFVHRTYLLLCCQSFFTLMLSRRITGKTDAGMVSTYMCTVQCLKNRDKNFRDETFGVIPMGRRSIFLDQEFTFSVRKVNPPPTPPTSLENMTRLRGPGQQLAAWVLPSLLHAVLPTWTIHGDHRPDLRTLATCWLQLENKNLPHVKGYFHHIRYAWKFCRVE
jgi:hypothetical protein